MRQLIIIVTAVSIPHAFVGCGNIDSDIGSLTVARSAAVLEVPGDYDTIGEAIAAVGLAIDDGDASDALLPTEGEISLIPPGAYMVILDPEYADEYTIPADAVLFRPRDSTVGSGLATNDQITLRGSDGVTVVSTHHHPFNPGNGISVERVDDRGDADALCSFDLVCMVILDAEAGFGGMTNCNFEPGECAQLSCRFAI